MTDQIDTTPEATTPEQAPQFMIQKMYVKDISFEAPNLPELFGGEYQPEIKMEMNSKSRKVAEDNYEVVLSVTLSATIGEKAAYLAEVHQAGLFLIKGFNEQQTHQLLGAAAPESLYPYVREVISGLIAKTGFPTLQITPVNFMGLYMENMKRMQEQAQAQAAETAGSDTVQ